MHKHRLNFLTHLRIRFGTFPVQENQFRRNRNMKIENPVDLAEVPAQPSGQLGASHLLLVHRIVERSLRHAEPRQGNHALATGNLSWAVTSMAKADSRASSACRTASSSVSPSVIASGTSRKLTM